MAKTNPFATGKDDDEATDREVEKLKKTAREEPEERDDDEDDSDEFEVGGGKDDDDGDDDDEPSRPSRRERRRERGDNLLRVERDRAERAERDAAETRRMLHETINRALPQRSQEPPKDQVAEQLEQEAKDLQKQQLGLTQRYAALTSSGKATQAEIDAMQAEGFALKDRMDANAFKRHSRQFGPRQQPGMTEAQVVAAANKARLQTEHADVMNHQVAGMYFRAEWMKLLDPRGDGSRAGGAPDDWDTLNSAMDKARRLAGLPPKGGRPAPTRGQQRKYSGVARGAGGGGDGPTTVKMTSEMKEMADAAYSHIKDPKKRYQHYVNRNAGKFAKGA